MNAVSFIAIVAGASTAIGILWVWGVLTFSDMRAEGGQIASILCIPGLAAIGLGLILTVGNGVLAVMP